MWIRTCSNDLLQSAQITSVQIRALAALWPSWRRLDVVIASLSFTRKREEHILNFTPSHSRFVLINRCLKNISSNISPNMFYWQLMIFNLIHRSSSTEKKAARKAQLALRETGPKTAVNCHVEYLDGLVCVFWGEDGVWGYIRSWKNRIWPNGGMPQVFCFPPRHGSLKFGTSWSQPFVVLKWYPHLAAWKGSCPCSKSTAVAWKKTKHASFTTQSPSTTQNWTGSTYVNMLTHVTTTNAPNMV